MPIYEYQCNNCDYEFETIHGITETLNCCPKCGKNLHKLISRSTFKLNGSGWASDGYTSPKPEKVKSGE